MIFKPYYYFETGCAAYLLGCGSDPWFVLTGDTLFVGAVNQGRQKPAR